jgi:hypothetical protein
MTGKPLVKCQHFREIFHESSYPQDAAADSHAYSACALLHLSVLPRFLKTTSDEQQWIQPVCNLLVLL